MDQIAVRLKVIIYKIDIIYYSYFLSLDQAIKPSY